MKKRILILIVVTLILPLTLQAQWDTLTAPFYRSSSVYFTDSLNGFLGVNKYIVHTQDGGKNWDSISVNSDVRDFDFINEEIGFCITTTGQALGHINHCIYKTTNKGIDWKIVNKGNLILNSIQFIDSLCGYIVGSKSCWNYAVLLKTIDGGENWEINHFPQYGSFRDIKMINNEVGFIAGSDSGKIVLKTKDGGNNWNKVFQIEYGAFSEIDFGDSLYGIVGGGYIGGTYRTIDGGINWLPISVPNTGAESISIHGQESWILTEDYTYDNVFSPTVIYSSDFGNSWVAILELDKMTLADDMFFLNNSFGWVTGTKTLYTQNGGFNSITIPTTPTLQSPPDDTLITTEQIQFEWSSEAYSFYRFQLATDSLFLEIKVDEQLIGNGYELFSLDEDTRYFWRVQSYNILGNSEWSDYKKFLTDDNFVDVSENIDLIKNFILHQNYPNPFNPSTIIKFSIPQTSYVKLVIYDMLGKEVITLINEEKIYGNYEVVFDGSKLSSGVYFYSLQSNGKNLTKKLLLLR